MILKTIYFKFKKNDIGFKYSMVKKSFKYNNFVAYNRKKIWVKYSCTHANNHAFKKWKKIKTL